jgi:hypothetical protein
MHSEGLNDAVNPRKNVIDLSVDQQKDDRNKAISAVQLAERSFNSRQFDNVQHGLDRIDWKRDKTPFRDLELIDPGDRHFEVARLPQHQHFLRLAT